jgi:hypothetical protein
MQNALLTTRKTPVERVTHPASNNDASAIASFTAVYDQAVRRLNRVLRGGQQIPRRLPSQSPPAVACFSKELLSFVVPEYLEYSHQRAALPVLGRVDQIEIFDCKLILCNGEPRRFSENSTPSL